MACIDSREVKCEEDILRSIIDVSRLSPQGTDGIPMRLSVLGFRGSISQEDEKKNPRPLRVGVVR